MSRNSIRRNIVLGSTLLLLMTGTGASADTGSTENTNSVPSVVAPFGNGDTSGSAGI